MPVIETAFALTLAYFVLLQVWMVLSSPHQARPYVARLSGRASKQEPIKAVFNRLLSPSGRRTW
jgi:hypothetical protein